MIDNLHLFISSYQIWTNIVIASMVVGALCGFLGVYVLLHRIVFVSAAMSQVSSVGVMSAFFLVQLEVLHAPHPYEDLLPLLLAAIFTVAFSVLIARQSQSKTVDRSKSAESIIGATYLLSNASLILIGDRITQGAHDVSNILFGNSVSIDSAHLVFLLVLCIPIFLSHIWLRKDLLFVSFDPAMAATMKYPVYLLRMFLLISLGMVISVGTRAIGALPVFAFSVLPAMCSLILFEGLGTVFFASSVIGGLCAVLGYFFSFVFSLPTGAAMAITCGLFLISAKAFSKMRFQINKH